MKTWARGCTEQRDTQAFSTHTCFSKLYLVCGPPLGPWHWSHCYKIVRSKSKSRTEVQNLQQDLLWLLGLNRYNPNGGSIKGTLCVLLPCQQNWYLWCQPPCGAGQWSCWPSWGESAAEKLKMENAEFLDFRKGIGATSPFCHLFFKIFFYYVTFNFCNWEMKWLS